LWCILVDTSKNTVPQSSLITPDTPKTAAVVLELLEPMFGHGHTLWIDNFFNSPELARKLKIEHSTDCVAERLDIKKKFCLSLNKIFIFYTKDM